MAVQVLALQVKFSDFTLGPVDLRVEDGIVAILGPNGSGKTTLLRAINGLVPSAQGRATLGDANLMGRDPVGLRWCAYVPDGDEMLFSELSLHEFWAFYASIRERSFGDDPLELLTRAYAFSERLSLSPGRVRLGEFSLGMRRKAQLITGLMTEPKVLMVDEPQKGLDFVSSREVRGMLGEVRDAGNIVIMSNHDLDSVARVADSIVVLREGAVVGRSSARFASADDCESYVAGYFA